jgi:hypothetical protein
MKTNRDLYKRITSLLDEKEDKPIPSLEDYLSNLLRRAGRIAHKEGLDLEEFFLLLRDSFEDSDEFPEAIPVEDAAPEFIEWMEAVVNQIRELREMAENGLLEIEYRELGLTAPGGGHWYNFDPVSYIECGIAGAFGGWEEGDSTGRIYVPGEVAFLDTEGKVEFGDPRELAGPPVEVSQITWRQFSDFVWCGQNYE